MAHEEDHVGSESGLVLVATLVDPHGPAPDFFARRWLQVTIADHIPADISRISCHVGYCPRHGDFYHFF